MSVTLDESYSVIHDPTDAYRRVHLVATYSDDAWIRLGEKLIARRVEIDPRYRNRRVFSQECELSLKLISDIETHARTNFGKDTLAAVELAYRWRPGSIKQVLAGLEPTPEEAAQMPAPQAPGYPFAESSPFTLYIWAYAGEDCTYLQKRSAIAAVLSQRRDEALPAATPHEQTGTRRA